MVGKVYNVEKTMFKTCLDGLQNLASSCSTDLSLEQIDSNPETLVVPELKYILAHSRGKGFVEGTLPSSKLHHIFPGLVPRIDVDLLPRVETEPQPDRHCVCVSHPVVKQKVRPLFWQL